MAKTQFGKQVKVIRSNNAKEFDDKYCRPYFADLGIIHQTSCTNSPQQNGRAERKHRNLLEMARVLRFQAGLPPQYWGECVQAATYITNRLPSHLLGNKTPYEVLHTALPDYTHMKCFGCFVVMASNEKTNHDKMNPRGLPCVFLGYPQTQRGYKLLDLRTNKLFVSRNVKFYETIYPYKIFHNTTQTNTQTSYDPNCIILGLSHEEECDIDSDDNITSTDTEQPEAQTLVQHPSDTQPEPTQPVRRSQRTHRSPTWLTDYHTSNLAYPSKINTITHTPVSPTYTCFMTQALKHTEPKSFREAISKGEWVQAMNEELEALELNNTWEITTLPPWEDTNWV